MVQEILLGVFVGVVVSFLAIFLTKKLAMAEKTMEAERGALQEQIRDEAGGKQREFLRERTDRATAERDIGQAAEDQHAGQRYDEG